MKNMMRHKGYLGTVEYSEEDHLLFGKLAYIRALVSYEGKDVDSLQRAFEEAVDHYLAFCQEAGKEPERPFRGSFNVRTGSDLHRRAVLYAKEHGLNLNALVTTALEKYLAQQHG